MKNDSTEQIAAHYADIMSALGEDISRDGIVKTPMRAAKAMEFLTEGYHQTLDEVINNAIFESDNDPMVIRKDI